MPAALCAGRLSIMTISLRLRDNSARRSYAIAAKRGHKGDGLPMPLRHTANQALTARATTAQPHHLGIGGGLVNEDQPGGIKHALFSHPAPARPRHVRALLLRCVQAFC